MEAKKGAVSFWVDEVSLSSQFLAVSDEVREVRLGCGSRTKNEEHATDGLNAGCAGYL